MTDEQFNTLAQFEPNFKTALECNYSRYPGQAGVDTLFRIWRELTNSRVNINRSCGTCILNLVKNVGKLWYQEKARRVAEQLEEERKKEEALKAEPEPKPDKAKKKATKKTAKKAEK